MSSLQAWRAAKSHMCPECRLIVEFEFEWYFVQEEGRVVHMLCWWPRLVRKWIVHAAV